MVICTKNAVLILVLMSSAFTCLPAANGCSGGCVVSGGGDASYNFIGDRAVDMDMSSFDDFVRDKIGNHQTTLRAIQLSHATMPKDNSSLNQTSNGNMSQNCSAVSPIINGQENATSDNKAIKLGAVGVNDYRASMVLAAFNNNML
jgi:hypothetical protein